MQGVTNTVPYLQARPFAWAAYACDPRSGPGAAANYETCGVPQTGERDARYPHDASTAPGYSVAACVCNRWRLS